MARVNLMVLRKARGWSLDNLAERADIRPSQLSRIEAGHRRRSLDQAGCVGPDDLGVHPGRGWFTVLPGPAADVDRIRVPRPAPSRFKIVDG
ncbi:helix-turn-helix domain-containing protein [Streptomyces sp. NPDC058731]|uniref:helix-turn-helix domain-containing protein n=1 Tax=Streptomyces sp. NPDC058731 TaxID=3346613 RepID=UPI003677E760